jgi:KDO2-lipid IV(A) lauroyltransferase
VQKLRDFTIVALLRVLSWLPFSVLQILGNALGSVLYIFRSRNRYTIESNLLYCFPEWSAPERDAVTRRTLKETAKNALEIGAIWHWPSDRTLALIREVQGRHFLDAALAQKRGVIILAPHLGNWEVVGLFLAHAAKTTSLYAPAKIPALDQLIYKGRTKNGAHLVPTNTSGVKALFKALRVGEMVGILPDQVPEEGSGVFAPFFGQPALTMTLVISLIQRTGAEVLCCYAKRRKDGQGFDMCVLPALDALKDAGDEMAAATAMNASIERCVSDCFEQYQWNYKRFRKRIPGSKNIYQS